MKHKRLRHNKSTAVPRYLVCVDTETRDDGTFGSQAQCDRLWFGHAVYWRMREQGGKLVQSDRLSLTFFRYLEFWDWLEKLAIVDTTIWVCCHNAGFDLTQLGTWQLMSEGYLKIQAPRSPRNRKAESDELRSLLILEDPPTVIGVETSTGHRYTLVDTLNYWRCSLSDLGKSVGLEKYDMPAKDEPLEKQIEYCTRDVEIIERAMTNLISWWDEREYGMFRWTSPGLAWSAFRHSFYTHGVDFHDSQQTRKLERDSYYGGQLEAYYLGEINEPVWQYDVNSLYPSVMVDRQYPVRLLAESHDETWVSGDIPYNPSACVAEVLLGETEHTFPFRYENEVFYARGPGITVLSGPELDYAFSMGSVEKVGRWAFYLCRPIFSQYIEHFFQQKQSAEDRGDKTTRTFVKLLMNSLYGKFGQKGSSWEPEPDYPAPLDCGEFTVVNPLSGERTRYLTVGGMTFRWHPGQEIGQSFPAIASFVTAYARQRMRFLRYTAGSENVYYQSTDSLIVNERGHKRLDAAGEVGERELGKLKLEKEADSAHIRGLHWYSLGAKQVTGSVKPSATWVSDTSWQEPHFERLAVILGRGGDSHVRIEQVTKERNLVYRKGHVGLDGWVTPFTGEELGAKCARDERLSERREGCQSF